MIETAIFGAGRIGKIHAGNLAAHPAARLKYVVDVDDSAARRDWGFAPAFDFQKAFDEYLVPRIRERYGN
jgi:predicted dehydrogenase